MGGCAVARVRGRLGWGLKGKRHRLAGGFVSKWVVWHGALPHAVQLRAWVSTCAVMFYALRVLMLPPAH